MATERYYLTCKKCYTEGPHVTKIHIHSEVYSVCLCGDCKTKLLEIMFDWAYCDCTETLRVLDEFLENG